MQTFLPYPNFIGSAKVLDSRRLGKQRVENLQIMQALLGKKVVNTAIPEETGLFKTVYYDRNHEPIPLDDLDVFDIWYKESVPITRLVPTPMSEWRIADYEPGPWQNHPAVLMWRGYEHVLMQYQFSICDEWTDRGHRDTCLAKTRFVYTECKPKVREGIPEWIGDEDFHRSHQSNLLRKHPAYYSQFFFDVPDDLPYVWPVSV